MPYVSNTNGRGEIEIDIAIYVLDVRIIRLFDDQRQFAGQRRRDDHRVADYGPFGSRARRLYAHLRSHDYIAQTGYLFIFRVPPLKQ